MKKIKRVSKIAKGKLAKVFVLKGWREKTTGGLTKNDLVKSKSGKVVVKKASLKMKKAYKGSKFEAWAKACAAARKQLGITGFVSMGGKTAQGRALSAKAKALYNSSA